MEICLQPNQCICKYKICRQKKRERETNNRDTRSIFRKIQPTSNNCPSAAVRDELFFPFPETARRGTKVPKAPTLSLQEALQNLERAGRAQEQEAREWTGRKHCPIRASRDTACSLLRENGRLDAVNADEGILAPAMDMSIAKRVRMSCHVRYSR